MHSTAPPTGKLSAARTDTRSKITRKRFVNFKEIHQTGPEEKRKGKCVTSTKIFIKLKLVPSKKKSAIHYRTDLNIHLLKLGSLNRERGCRNV